MVRIKKEVENKTKTYLQRPNITTYLQKLNMFMSKEHIYIYTWKKWEAETRARGKRDIGQCFS